jgi:hypothetical protein
MGGLELAKARLVARLYDDQTRDSDDGQILNSTTRGASLSFGHAGPGARRDSLDFFFSTQSLYQKRHNLNNNYSNQTLWSFSMREAWLCERWRKIPLVVALATNFTSLHPYNH